MLTAIIVSYHSASTIRECIDAAVAAGVEQIVIWENSGKPALVVEPSDAVPVPLYVYGDGDNSGFGGGVNRAIAAAGLAPTDEVLLLNPDCIVSRETITSMRTVLNRPGVGLVAPRMRYADGRGGIAGGTRPTLLKEVLAMTRIDDLLPADVRRWAIGAMTRRSGASSYADSLRPGEPVHVDWVSGFCILISVDTLSRVEGFDESYFLYFEDVDLCHRVRELGLDCVIDRTSSALHYESVSTRASGKGPLYRAGMWKYFSKHGSRTERAIARRMLVGR